jgi:hypothetical protein
MNTIKARYINKLKKRVDAINTGFSIEAVTNVIKALKDDASGNTPCTMTDLDFAVKMLDELVTIKTSN